VCLKTCLVVCMMNLSETVVLIGRRKKISLYNYNGHLLVHMHASETWRRRACLTHDPIYVDVHILSTPQSCSHHRPSAHNGHQVCRAVAGLLPGTKQTTAHKFVAGSRYSPPLRMFPFLERVFKASRCFP
jgi:hypothetical protein